MDWVRCLSLHSNYFDKFSVDENDRRTIVAVYENRDKSLEYILFFILSLKNNSNQTFGIGSNQSSIGLIGLLNIRRCCSIGFFHSCRWKTNNFHRWTHFWTVRWTIRWSGRNHLTLHDVFRRSISFTNHRTWYFCCLITSRRIPLCSRSRSSFTIGRDGMNCRDIIRCRHCWLWWSFYSNTSLSFSNTL